MDLCRLSVNTTGAFFHPLGDVTPIDCRYGEEIGSVDLPDKLLIRVTGKTPIPYGRLRSVRGIAISNVSNQGTQSQPTPDEAAQMASRVLFVGFGSNDEPSLMLPPMVPGKAQLGGSQFLWLQYGAQVWLSTPKGVSVTARIQLFPGPLDG